MSGFVATVGKVKIPSRPDFMAGLYVDEMRKRERFMNEDTSKQRLHMFVSARENTVALTKRIERSPLRHFHRKPASQEPIRKFV
jgi:hypothetical protein